MVKRVIVMKNRKIQSHKNGIYKYGSVITCQIRMACVKEKQYGDHFCGAASGKAKVDMFNFIKKVQVLKKIARDLKGLKNEIEYLNASKLNFQRNL